MSAKNRPVTSREYKFMLNADRFYERKQGIESFWQLVKFLLRKQGVNTESSTQFKEQNKEKHRKQRKTQYYDTSSFALRRRGFVLRLREESEPDEEAPYRITLKYRAPDRYEAAGQDTTSPHGNDFKFEEDIIPPFASKFANSTSFRKKSAPNLETMANLVELFPGLATLGIPETSMVGPVNHFEAVEVAHQLGKIWFKEEVNEEVEVKCCLSFWFLQEVTEDTAELPLVAEFSFDYDLPNRGKIKPTALEQFPVATVQQTNRFFQALQRQEGWINLKATTKTAYAYSAF